MRLLFGYVNQDSGELEHPGSNVFVRSLDTSAFHAATCATLRRLDPDVVVLRVEAESPSASPAVTHVVRRYWYAPEIGWMVLPEAEGRGIAAEAARALRDWAYATQGWTTLVSHVHPENARSIRLAERLGARLDPSAPHPEDDPCLVYRHPGPEGRA